MNRLSSPQYALPAHGHPVSGGNSRRSANHDPQIVGAANSFLSTLDEKQRKSVLFAFDDEQQRVRWSNLPVRMVPRAGLSLGELSAPQRSAAMALLSSALSRRGFEKVQQIMDGDEVLKTNGRNNPMFGKDLFFISILGTPSEKSPWMLQFGGHHLALNITIAGRAGHSHAEPDGCATRAVHDERQDRATARAGER